MTRQKRGKNIKRPLLFLAAGFVLGEIFGLRLITATAFFAAFAAAYLLFGAVFKKDTALNFLSSFEFLKTHRIYIILFLIFFMTGFSRADFVRAKWEAELETPRAAGQCAISGRISELSVYDDHMQAVVTAEAASDGEKPADRISVYMKNDARTGDMLFLPAVGDRVRISGSMKFIYPAGNPGQFDMSMYYRAKGVCYSVYADRWEVLGRGSEYFHILGNLQKYGRDVFEKEALPEYAGLFCAVVLGDKSLLSDETRELYQKNGISHLLAISALHLSVVGLASYGMLRKLGAGFIVSGILGSMVLVSYGFMTGGSASVLRALVMTVCAYTALGAGRTYDLLSALSLSLVCLLFISPWNLFGAGAQLSFAAVCGIALGSGAADNLGVKNPFAKTLFVSIGIQSMTLPLIMYHYFKVPPYAFFLNLLVVPLLGLAVWSGAAAILLHALSVPASVFALGAGHAVFFLYDRLCRMALCFPFSSVTTGRPGIFSMGLWYGTLFALLLPAKHRGRVVRKERKKLYRHSPAELLAVVFMLIIIRRRPYAGLELSFLDIGQGDCICIEAEGLDILVDGGSTDNKSAGEDILLPWLMARAVTRLDYVFITHPDMDHQSAVIELLRAEEGPDVGTLVLSAAAAGDSGYDALLKAAADKNVDVTYMSEGGRLKKGRLELLCLAPGKDWQCGDDKNMASIVMKCSYGSFFAVLTGDMPAAGETRILEKHAADLKGTAVLKAGHHGSSTSSSKDWLEAMDMSAVIISCGRDNSYGHPHREVTDRLEDMGADVYITHRTGAVTVKSRGNSYRISSFLGH